MTISQSGDFSHHCTLNFTEQWLTASVSLGYFASLLFHGVQSVIVATLVLHYKSLDSKTIPGESKAVIKKRNCAFNWYVGVHCHSKKYMGKKKIRKHLKSC